jgi:hypothetical protein
MAIAWIAADLILDDWSASGSRVAKASRSHEPGECSVQAGSRQDLVAAQKEHHTSSIISTEVFR